MSNFVGRRYRPPIPRKTEAERAQERHNQRVREQNRSGMTPAQRRFSLTREDLEDHLNSPEYRRQFRGSLLDPDYDR